MRFRYFRNLLSILLLLNATACAATSKLFDADARVIDRNGAPCFTIGEDAEIKNARVVFQGISVNSEAQENVQTFWDISSGIDNPPFYLQASNCLLYGARFDKAKVFTEPKALESGKIYELFLHTKVSDDSTIKSRRYYARFCLLRQTNGTTRVHQIMRDNGWRNDVCSK